MDVCDRTHEEIVYNGRSCPLCDAKEKIEQLTDKTIELEGTIEKLNQEES